MLKHTSAPTDGGTNGKVDANGQLTLDKGTKAQFLAIVKDTDSFATDPTLSTQNVVGNFAEALTPGYVVHPSSTFIQAQGVDPTYGPYDHRLTDAQSIAEEANGAFSSIGGEVDSDGSMTFAPTLYIGFAFGDTPNYGYLQFDFIESDLMPPFGSGFNRASAMLTGFAYDDSGAPIEIVAIPEPATLSLLGIGGMLLVARRKR